MESDESATCFTWIEHKLQSLTTRLFYDGLSTQLTRHWIRSRFGKFGSVTNLFTDLAEIECALISIVPDPSFYCKRYAYYLLVGRNVEILVFFNLV